MSHTRTRRAAGALATLAALSVLLGAGAVRASDRARIERVDVSYWPTITLGVSYVDSEGRVITGRGKEDFKLILDSAEQGGATSAKSYDGTGQPIHVIAVVQLSSAMEEALEEIKKGVRALAEGLDVKSKSKMGLLGYSSETKRLAELTNPADVEAEASKIQLDSEGVEPHMLDAVRTAIDLLNAAPKNERKLVVLFSDGIDVNISTEKRAFTAIGRRAQEGGIVIDTIGYAPYEQTKLRNLSELAKQSSGSDRTCKTPSDVTAQFLNIVDEIKKQYLVTFEVPLAADAKEHTFQTIVDQAGRTAYSNTITKKIPDRNFHEPSGKKSRWWIWALVGGGVLALVLLVAWLVFRDTDDEMAPPLPAPPPPGPMAAPQPMAAPGGRPRTMAMEAMGGASPRPSGGGPAVGWLVVVNGGRYANQTFKFKPSRTVIGSAPDCDIVIEEPYISSKHCETQVLPNGNYKLIDLGSTNGVVVNDRRVREHELIDSDIVKLGKMELKFKFIHG